MEGQKYHGFLGYDKIKKKQIIILAVYVTEMKDISSRPLRTWAVET